MSEPNRRIRFVLDVQSTVEYDPEKLYEGLLGEKMSIAKIENFLCREIESGEMTRDGIAGAIKKDGDSYEKYEYTSLDVEIEEQCEVHPTVWFHINPMSTSGCPICKTERRGKK